jgi:hypothetical protein
MRWDRTGSKMSGISKGLHLDLEAQGHCVRSIQYPCDRNRNPRTGSGIISGCWMAYCISMADIRANSKQTSDLRPPHFLIWWMPGDGHSSHSQRPTAKWEMGRSKSPGIRHTQTQAAGSRQVVSIGCGLWRNWAAEASHSISHNRCLLSTHVALQ